jgi:hypothetical protein
MRIRVLPFVLLAAALSLYADVHTVSKVAIVAKPKVYTGPCPADVQFIGTIFVNRYPVNVTYRFERSDGAAGPRRTVTIRSAGQGVYDTWHLGDDHKHLNVWEKVHVLAPTGISSPEGHATVNCR